MWKMLTRYPVIGITFTRNEAYAALAIRGLRHSQLERSIVLQRENLLEAGENNEWDTLTQVIGEVFSEFSVGPAVSRVVLPTPLANLLAIASPVRPKNQREGEAMVAWRAANLVGTKRSFRSTAQYFSESDSTCRIIGVAADQSLCSAIEKAVINIPAALTVIDTAASIRWNNLPTVLRAGAGVLVDVLDDYWILTVWDDTGWPALIKSMWRAYGVVAGGDATNVSCEILRLLTAHAEDEDGLSVGRCYLMAAEHEADAFSAALSGALGMAPSVIRASDGRREPRVASAGTRVTEILAREIACAS